MPKLFSVLIFYYECVKISKKSRDFNYSGVVYLLCCEVEVQEQIEAVQRMQEYIAAHLSENITLDDLAKVAMFSPWYARPIFIALR